MSLILASASPRRRSLLESAGLSFTVSPADVDETPRPGESATSYAARVALEKAQQGAEAADVLAADTVVELGGAILGKPADAAEAAATLRALSGRVHRVHTAVALRTGDVITQMLVTSEVQFRVLTDAEITTYIATNEPFDKAGGYGIQGAGMGLVHAVRGSYTNVIGLPLAETLALLEQAGLR